MKTNNLQKCANILYFLGYLFRCHVGLLNTLSTYCKSFPKSINLTRYLGAQSLAVVHFQRLPFSTLNLNLVNNFYQTFFLKQLNV